MQRDVSLYRDGGLEALRTSGREYRPTSDLAQYTDIIRRSLEEQPARTIAEACERIKGLTGVERRPTQVRRFLKSIGLKWQRVRAIPVPPKKSGRAQRHSGQLLRHETDSRTGSGEDWRRACVLR